MEFVTITITSFLELIGSSTVPPDHLTDFQKSWFSVIAVFRIVLSIVSVAWLVLFAIVYKTERYFRSHLRENPEKLLKHSIPLCALTLVWGWISLSASIFIAAFVVVYLKKKALK